jgi:shikimate kinase
VSRVILIGARASGKSTIGSALSRALHAPWIDLDEPVRAALGGGSVVEIWRECGEAAWRAEEARQLARLLAEDQIRVIALGGGAVTAPGVMELLRDAKARGCMIVYLECSSAVLASRLAAQPGDRPSLTGRSVADEIEEVLNRRRSLYESISDVVIDTAAAAEADVVHRILDFLDNRPDRAAHAAR